jgi:hypothetical protein
VGQDTDFGERSSPDIDGRVRELLRDARLANRIDKDRAELFEGMIKSKAWQEYIALLDAKIQGMADVILAPANTQNGLIALEYVKGAMSGLILARDLPKLTVTAMMQQSEDSDE